MEETSLTSATKSPDNEIPKFTGRQYEVEVIQLEATENVQHLQRSPNGEDDEDSQEAQKEEKHGFTFYSTELERPLGVILFFLLYSLLTVISWAMICILTFHPLPLGTYVNVWNSLNPNFDDAAVGLAFSANKDLRSFYDQSHLWYQAAQVMEALVALLTLSFTSLICSKCVVAYLQKVQHGTTLRRTLTLADMGWLKPGLYLDLFRIRRLRSRSSTPLFIFMVVTFVGLIIPALQQILVTDISIRVPANVILRPWDVGPGMMQPVDTMMETVDIADLISGQVGPGNRLSVIAGQAFMSTQLQYPVPNLWIDSSTTMSCPLVPKESGMLSRQLLPQIFAVPGCGQNYGYTPTERPPFLTQIPAFTNTGLIKQFAPRMNSSVSYFEIDSFPSDCNEKTAGFYVEYKYAYESGEGSNTYFNFTVKACSLSAQPAWKNSRDRQDVQEDFYIHLNVGSWDFAPQESTFQAQSNTTLGWFELPNHLNNNRYGPLLDKDPFPCHDDAWANQLVKIIYTRQLLPREVDGRSMSLDPEAFTLSTHQNIGPLSLSMLALFGPESWFAQQTYIAQQNLQWPVAPPDSPTVAEKICAGIAPLALLNAHSDTLLCINSLDTGYDNNVSIPTLWLEQFFDQTNTQAALGAAVVLASNVWLSNPLSFEGLSLAVISEKGITTVIPAMSTASMVIISSLWGIYLTCLFAMICYALSTKAWTNSMDSFTLLKMGAALHDQIGMLISKDETKVKILDELPGWFGDERPLAKVGKVGLGARAPLTRARSYASYHD